MHNLNDIQICESSLSEVVGGGFGNPSNSSLLIPNLKEGWSDKHNQFCGKIVVAGLLWLLDPAIEMAQYVWDGKTKSKSMEKYDRGEIGLASFYLTALTDEHFDVGAMGSTLVAAAALNDLFSNAIGDTIAGKDSRLEKKSVTINGHVYDYMRPKKGDRMEPNTIDEHGVLSYVEEGKAEGDKPEGDKPERDKPESHITYQALNFRAPA